MSPTGALNSGPLQGDIESRSRTSVLVGDKYNHSHPTDVRILGWNINGVPHHSSVGNGKNARVHRTLNMINPDIVCFSELNVAWNLIPHQDRFDERINSWWKGSR